MATIILGISGSIAAYKAADIASQLVKRGHEVHCVCTPTALRFVTPLTLMTLSRQPVICEFDDETHEWQPAHIKLAKMADLLCIVPASANTMACMAQGLAPNALTSLYLACSCPVLIFPAMNGQMWQHIATQQNACILAERDRHSIYGPDDSGILACGDQGAGKLLPVARIIEHIEDTLATR